MPHAGSMCRASETPLERMGGVIQELATWVAQQPMDPGQFVAVTKNFEHQVDAESALSEANRAHQRRYLQIGEAINGLVRIEGQVTPDAGAIIRTAIEPYAKPSKNDERTAGQRLADALVEYCGRGGAARASG